ncbi:MAG: helix-turn-helix transcriptional regulator [Candidatus Rokubacteria bacterium]|nr:helix-turn-helix transcriptional regulator [Candidatus Rokubacteria bacterium]
MSTLGERVRALRMERRLQQRQLAENADLTPSMVSQIESGRLTPSLNTLGKIAAALGVPIATLFDGRPAGQISIRLETGDSALLDGGTPHGWDNLGRKPARALWVILG